jgi:hypothetical protein
MDDVGGRVVKATPKIRPLLVGGFFIVLFAASFATIIA